MRTIESLLLAWLTTYEAKVACVRRWREAGVTYQDSAEYQAEWHPICDAWMSTRVDGLASRDRRRGSAGSGGHMIDEQDAEELAQLADRLRGLQRHTETLRAQALRTAADAGVVLGEIVAIAQRASRMAAERAEEARAERVATLSGELRDLLASEAANT